MNVLRPFWIIAFCVGIVVSALAQERWQPFKLHPDVQSLKLVYDVKTRNNAPVQYGIDVRREGEGMVRLKVETEADLPEDQLGVQSLFGLWNIYGISAMVFLIHPKVFLPLESTAYGTDGKVESTAVLKQAEIK